MQQRVAPFSYYICNVMLELICFFCRFAAESIDMACKWGYKGVESGVTLSGIYRA